MFIFYFLYLFLFIRFLLDGNFFVILKTMERMFLLHLLYGGVSVWSLLLLIPLFNINGALISFLISKLGYSLTLRYFAKSLGFQRRVFIEKNFNIFMPFITLLIILLILDHF